MAEIIEKVKAMMVLDGTEEVHAEDLKYSIQSYIRQIELSHTKNLSVTPEQRFVDALRDVLGSNRLRDRVDALISMQEDAEERDINDYL